MNGTQGVWEAKYWWAPEKGATLSGNGELQWYVNPRYAATSASNPFSVSNGVLTIRAEKTPDALKAEVGGHAYTSGMLTTHASFSQTYGYFEIRADMPDEKGVWPAFWLLPEDGSWPPELDVVEMRGPGPQYRACHGSLQRNRESRHPSPPPSASPKRKVSTPTVSFGRKTRSSGIIDDVAVARADTPSDMHKPMYMIVNLAVGGMAGAPSDGLPNGSDMKIDYIRAYTLDDLA